MTTLTLTPTGEYVHATRDGVATLCGKPAGAERPDLVAALARFGYELEVGREVGADTGRFGCLSCDRILRRR